MTHLLMPLLGRAGLGGVAMVVCVNPQSDDYDETISILGKQTVCRIFLLSLVSAEILQNDTETDAILKHRLID